MAARSFRVPILRKYALLIGVPVMAGLFAIAAAEAVARQIYPWLHEEIKWDAEFVDDVGFLFKANTIIKHTNKLDFSVQAPTNSLGFLDFEPSPLPGGCHVTFIGDSLVEAAQVEIKDKFQRIIQNEAANKFPEWRLTTSAFGYSGTGQLNQLPFYDKFAKQHKSKLLVLVFVSNDFANNSAILESLRYGWHPQHAPRVFARKMDDAYEITHTDKDWRHYLIYQPEPSSAPFFHELLKRHSMLYLWGWLTLSNKYPNMKCLEGANCPDTVLSRARTFKRKKDTADQMTMWKDEYAANLDGDFRNLADDAMYLEATQFTEYAIREFQKRAREDNAELAILAADQMRLLNHNGSNRSFETLKAMAEKLSIPLIDQYDFIVANGGNPIEAQFKYDNHWSKQGHKWASEAVLHFINDSKVCSK